MIARFFSPGKILFRSSVICFAIAATLFGWFLKPIERLPLSNHPLSFQAQRAYENMKSLATQFPNRLPWHPNRLKAKNWLKKQLKQLGYDTQEMVFSEVIAGKRYANLTNLYVLKKGTLFPDQIVTVSAHYDTTDTTHEGAMDDASGVGTVLELARIFAHQNTRRSILFLLTDSEEFGAFWGARVFAKSFPQAQKIIADLNFDFVGPKGQTSILTLCDGLKSGFTPLWFRELALDSIRSVGEAHAKDLHHVIEYMQRALLIPAADHGAFLAQGIPALNWVGQTDHFAYQMAFYHHTVRDTVAIMDSKAFSAYGKSAERLLWSIDALETLPKNFRETQYWKITQDYYLPKGIVLFLQILSFIPFLLYSFFRFRFIFQKLSKPLFKKILKNEAKNVFLLLAAFFISYTVVRLLPSLKIITQYELFPATQKSAILYNPNLFALALVFFITIGVFFLFRAIFKEKTDQEAYLEIRHSFLALFFTTITFIAFLKSPYLATLLLLPPAYFWVLLKPSRTIQNRLINVILLLLGSSTCLVIAFVMTYIFDIGIFYWYLFLAVSYGLISVYASVIAICIGAILLRFLWKFVF